MLGRNCDLKTRVQNLGYPPTNRRPKNHLFGRHRNLMPTLTAYVFGMKCDIENRSSALTTITLQANYMTNDCRRWIQLTIENTKDIYRTWRWYLGNRMHKIAYEQSKRWTLEMQLVCMSAVRWLGLINLLLIAKPRWKILGVSSSCTA